MGPAPRGPLTNVMGGGSTSSEPPKFGAAADATKPGKLAQTGVAGAGRVLVKARGKHINRW